MASQETTFLKVLRELADAFVSDKRADGARFYRLRDDAPTWLRDQAGRDVMHAVHVAVDGASPRLPDDWIYEETAGIAYALAHDYSCEDADQARDRISEIADNRIDAYNSARAAWLASHLSNGALVDDAVTEGIVSSDADLYERIGMGQYVGAQRIAYCIVDQCESEASDRDDAIANGTRCPDDLSAHPSIADREHRAPQHCEAHRLCTDCRPCACRCERCVRMPMTDTRR